MANYAVIDNELVINIIVADSKEIAEEASGKLCVECTNQPVYIGLPYQDENFVFPTPE
jgi:hypothetical protein